MKKQIKQQIEKTKFEDFLVVEKGKFFIEVFDERGKLLIDPLFSEEEKASETKLVNTLFGNSRTESARFPLRTFTQEEKAKIQKSSMYKLHGEKTRSQPFQHLLNRWLEEVLVLDADEFNKRYKQKKLRKSLIITEGKFSLF